MTFAALDADVRRVTAGLVAHGVARGDRVALLDPARARPHGVPLRVLAHGRGRGDRRRGPRRAWDRSRTQERDAAFPHRHTACARPRRGSSAGPVSGSPQDRCPRPRRGALGVSTSLDAIRRGGEGHPLPPTPDDADPAAVIFTSGATGPAKGVVYRHHQLQAQRDVLARLYDIGDDDRFVAAFAPFALYGPAMGVPSVVPDMRRHRARHAARGRARRSRRGDRRVARVRVTRGARQRDRDRRRSHAAPSGSARSRATAVVGRRAGVELRAARRGRALPNAVAHTPYGMTEVLPVADITPAGIDAAGAGNGVCVGPPIAEVSVAISALDDTGNATGALTTEAGVVGEVCIQAAHAKDSYDKLWVTQHRSEQPAALAPQRRRRAPRRRGTAVDRGPHDPHHHDRERSRDTGRHRASRRVGRRSRSRGRGRRRPGRDPAGRRRRWSRPSSRAGRISRRARSPNGSAPRRASTSPRCWSFPRCRSTSGTTRRSTGRGWPSGRRGVLAGGRMRAL